VKEYVQAVLLLQQKRKSDEEYIFNDMHHSNVRSICQYSQW